MPTREEDIATEMFICNTHNYILFFTDKGRVYRVKCYNIPEGTRQSKGINIANILPIATDENVTSMIPVKEFEEDKFLIMVTKYGVIKRISLSAYNTARKGGLIALDLNEGDELAWVKMTTGEDEIIIATREGMAIRFNENDVRPMGRLARGVKAMKLREGDTVVGMSVINPDGLVLTVSETGYGRLSNPDNYRLQSRGGKGLTNYHVEKYGKVAGISVINPDDDIILISEEGVVIRINASSVRICARPSKGVTLMRIGENNRVVSFAHLPHDDDEETEQPADNSAPDDEAEITDEE
jgi:DNA gyrase subunit A